MGTVVGRAKLRVTVEGETVRVTVLGVGAGATVGAGSIGATSAVEVEDEAGDFVIDLRLRLGDVGVFCVTTAVVATDL